MPIYYVNDLPHIGHTYTTILANVLAHYHWPLALTNMILVIREALAGQLQAEKS